jgi:hypothetical protein
MRENGEERRDESNCRGWKLRIMTSPRSFQQLAELIPLPTRRSRVRWFEALAAIVMVVMNRFESRQISLAPKNAVVQLRTPS